MLPRASLPKSITHTIFVPSNPSGGLAHDALPGMMELGSWSNAVLLIGDAGRNSETAILYENFIHSYDGPLTLTRDAIDLIRSDSQQLVERPNTLIVASFAQVQKLFSSVYYPKILTFSMHLQGLVEALHKFTLTYPVAITVLHKDHLLVAADGEVTSTSWQNPMAIWRGQTATKATVYWLWHPHNLLAGVTASLVGSD